MLDDSGYWENIDYFHVDYFQPEQPELSYMYNSHVIFHKKNGRGVIEHD